MGAAVIGMERIALWIARCAVYEQLYFTGDVISVPEVAVSAMNDLKNALLALYTTILEVLSRLIKVFNGTYPAKTHWYLRLMTALGNTYQNLKSIATFPDELKKLDLPESTVTAAVGVVENCCK